MTKLNPDFESPVAETIERYLQSMPVVVTGINRKVYIGNYETIDIYHALIMPAPQAAEVGLEGLKEIVEAVSAECYSMNAREVNERYTTIKNMVSPPRQ